MSRLTKRLQEGKALCIEECEKECTEGYYECHKCKPFADVLKKLADYEDAEEQGLILRLPCKVGDTVYALTPFCEICEEALDNTYACENCSKGNFITETKFDYEMIRMLGKTVFLTKEEAEQALKQMGE